MADTSIDLTVEECVGVDRLTVGIIGHRDADGTELGSVRYGRFPPIRRAEISLPVKCSFAPSSTCFPTPYTDIARCWFSLCPKPLVIITEHRRTSPDQWRGRAPIAAHDQLGVRQRQLYLPDMQLNLLAHGSRDRLGR